MSKMCSSIDIGWGVSRTRPDVHTKKKQEQLERTMTLLQAEQQLHKTQREMSEQNESKSQAALRSLQQEVLRAGT
jgi:hypothetical protein